MAKKKIKKRGIVFSIILAVLILLMMFGAIVGGIGYLRFTETMTDQYNNYAYHTAETAAQLVSGDSIDSYLTAANGDDGEFTDGIMLDFSYRNDLLSRLCLSQDVSIIYIIAVDTTDYEHFYSVFNCPHPSTKYTPWELGSLKYTTQTSGNQYQNAYKDLYENGVENTYIIRTTNLNGAFPHITSMVPLKRSDGSVSSIICVQLAMEDINVVRYSYLTWVIIATALLIIASTTVYIFHIKRQIVNPIKALGDEAHRFADKNSMPEKPLTADISQIREISTLAASIGDMENDTLRYIENLSNAIQERERIDTELAMATKIQADLLPNVFPAFPDRKDFDIYATMSPAKEVGGDFYDFFLIDEYHLGLVIADVSGKGVPAALFMMMSKILVQNYAMMGLSPKDVLSSVNDQICKNNREEMFVTVWFGVLDLKTGSLTAANAGHEYPILKNADGDFCVLKDKHGFVIGGMHGLKYREYEMKLEKGSKLFLYTDGVAEATDAGSNMFGVDGTVTALNEIKEGAPAEIIASVDRAIKKFVGDAPQFDDITMMCVSFFGNDDDKNEKTMTVDAIVENIDAVTDFVNEELDMLECPLKTRTQIAVAIDELFGNIARYAYGKAVGTATVKVETRQEPKEVCITFIDGGMPYDPLSAADPDITLSADERKIGGLGVFLVKKTMDDVKYEYKDGKNVLHIVKKL